MSKDLELSNEFIKDFDEKTKEQDNILLRSMRLVKVKAVVGQSRVQVSELNQAMGTSLRTISILRTNRMTWEVGNLS